MRSCSSISNRYASCCQSTRVSCFNRGGSRRPGCVPDRYRNARLTSSGLSFTGFSIYASRANESVARFFKRVNLRYAGFLSANLCNQRIKHGAEFVGVRLLKSLFDLKLQGLRRLLFSLFDHVLLPNRSTHVKASAPQTARSFSRCSVEHSFDVVLRKNRADLLFKNELSGNLNAFLCAASKTFFDEFPWRSLNRCFCGFGFGCVLNCFFPHLFGKLLFENGAHRAGKVERTRSQSHHSVDIPCFAQVVCNGVGLLLRWLVLVFFKDEL